MDYEHRRGRRSQPLTRTNPNEIDIGITLRAWKNFRGFSSQDLAVAAGLGKNGRGYVSKIEHGIIKKPTKIFLGRLAQALNIEPETLTNHSLPNLEEVPGVLLIETEIAPMGLAAKVERLERQVELLMRILEDNGLKAKNIDTN